MKKYAVLMAVAALFLLSACEKLGITKNEANDDTAAEEIVKNEQNLTGYHSSGDEEISNLRHELETLMASISEKESVILQKDGFIEELQYKITSVETELNDMKKTITDIAMERNIAGIIAGVSLLLNIVLLYIVLRKRSEKEKIPALPPVPADKNGKDENFAKTAAQNMSDSKETLNIDAADKENKNETANISDDKKPKQEVKKRGRKPAEKKPADNAAPKKRGRRKKTETAAQTNADIEPTI